jgi:hypothetical protein
VVSEELGGRVRSLVVCAVIILKAVDVKHRKEGP